LLKEFNINYGSTTQQKKTTEFKKNVKAHLQIEETPQKYLENGLDFSFGELLTF
jgi:hypothetical protein